MSHMEISVGMATITRLQPLQPAGHVFICIYDVANTCSCALLLKILVHRSPDQVKLVSLR